MLKGFETLHNRILDFARGFVQLISPAGPVGEYDSKEDRRFSAPILSKYVLHVHDIRGEHWLKIVDCLIELRPMDEGGGDVHYLIMALFEAPPFRRPMAAREPEGDSLSRLCRSIATALRALNNGRTNPEFL